MSQNKSTRTKCEKKQKYRDLKMGFAIFFYCIERHLNSSVIFCLYLNIVKLILLNLTPTED